MNMHKNIEDNLVAWDMFVRHESLIELPESIKEKLKSFQKVILIKTVRQQNLTEAMKHYVRLELG